METKKREFIDPNDLMEYINKNHCYSGLPMAAHICTMELLTYAPRVDVVEVVHGCWEIDKEKDVVRCSVCGYETPTLMPYVCNGEKWVPCYVNKYCGNCGAKMDLKEKENLCISIKLL